MASYWKSAGLGYLQYVEMCSRATRSCLKEPLRNVAIKRSEEGIKFYKWNSGVRDLKVGDATVAKN